MEIDVVGLSSQLNPMAILPEGVVITTLIIVLIGDLLLGRASVRWTPYAAIVGLLTAVGLLYTQWDNPNPVSFLGSFTADNFSIVFRGIIALSAAVTILMSIRYVDQAGSSIGEFMSILLSATVGGMFLSGSEELVMIFVSLETLSIASYLLTGYMKRDPRSNEAALKYLLIGASSSAIFLYGLSLLYGLSGGETHLTAIATVLGDGTQNALGLLIALVFVIAGISFKIAAVPFHQWTPDVYEGSPTPVVAFLSVGSKAAGFALAIRLLTEAFPAVIEQWQFIFTALAILSMILGNVVAIAQTSMKRMLAYSSIAQAGFVMIGMVIGTEAGYASMLFYLPVHEPGGVCLRDSVLPAHGDRSNQRILRSVSERSAADAGLKSLPVVFGGDSTPGWIFWEAVSVLGRLAGGSLWSGDSRSGDECGIDLLLHSCGEDDGGEGIPRNVGGGEELPGAFLATLWHASITGGRDCGANRYLLGRNSV
jgi:NAD(P)H-quinone oxidoreductase subunit 2